MELAAIALTAWGRLAAYAAGHVGEFVGWDKETALLRRFREEIQGLAGSIQVCGPDVQARYGVWSIDIVCSREGRKIAIEGKFKTRSDGAVPDNRKAAFFDLYKLEQYVVSGEYAEGLFLWLTDSPAYLVQATGDSAAFSTHKGRVYEPGTPLTAKRARNNMPLPLGLKFRYVFDWEPVKGGQGWHTLTLRVPGTANYKT